MSLSLSDLAAADPSSIRVWQNIVAYLRQGLGPDMTSSTPTATPMKHAFERRVAGVKSVKSDINTLILDYLTMEGYPQAAANFSKEANLHPQQDTLAIKSRQQIQHFIHQGNIDDAINSLNELDSEILDKDPPLHFALLRLQLVELIRSCGGGDISPALTFATQQLGPRAPTSPEFLEDLEKTMTLLIFPANSHPPEVAALLKPELRRQVADKVNQAILYHHSNRRNAAIRDLVKMRAWAENIAREKQKELPEHIDLGLNGDDHEMMDERLHETEHEPMITT